MSRSVRKSPYHYYCGDNGSDRASKIIWHKRMRARIRTRLHNLDPESFVLPHFREVSNVWCMKGDCKFRFDPREHPEWLRK